LYSNLLFVIFILILINLTSELQPSYAIDSPFAGFLAGIGGYFATLGAIYIQNLFIQRKFPGQKNLLLIASNLELCLWLAFFLFVFGAPRVFEYIPILGQSQTFLSLFSLSLYLGGLWVFHYSSFAYRPIFQTRQANQQLCMIVPFVLPFLLFSVLIDLFQTIPSLPKSAHSELIEGLFAILTTLIFLVLMMVFMPAIMQWIWQCKPLENREMNARLEKICQKAHFKHAGIKTWTIMDHALTAAIIGIVPKFRYVMFTKHLLNDLSPEAIEAILAHEIGHSYRKHLLFYPLIFWGMVMALSLFSVIFSEAIAGYFSIKNLSNPSSLWNIIYPFAFLIPYLIIIGLYFRLVFGFFSRLFERQADLHVFLLNIPVQSMIEALNQVGVLTGNSHLQPSWHHYSIQERIDFLKQADENPQLIIQHHRKVKKWIMAYVIIIVVAMLIIFFKN